MADTNDQALHWVGHYLQGYRNLHHQPALKAQFFTACSILLMLGACQQQDDSAKDAKPQGQSTELSEHLVEKKDVFKDGFYDVNTDSSQVSDDSVGLPQTPVSNSQLSDDASVAIVLDSEFSRADTDPGLLSTESATQPFCIDQVQSSDDPNTLSPTEACKRIANRLASVSEDSCNAAALQPSQCESVNGFPILLREFSPLANKLPQGRILVIGGTHGDELTSVSVTFRWIEKLNKYHSGLFHWHMVPMMNPDGVLKRGATRTNQSGVDLNRNMPSDDWHENALKYWRQKTGENPRRFPGNEPASEPETQWLVDEINLFKPDAIISVHAPYGVVDFDSLLLNVAPRSLGKLHLNLLGTYPGSLGNYAGINRNIPVITLELPHAWEMPSDAETTKIWEDIVSWLRKNIQTDTAVTN